MPLHDFLFPERFLSKSKYRNLMPWTFWKCCEESFITHENLSPKKVFTQNFTASDVTKQHKYSCCATMYHFSVWYWNLALQTCNQFQLTLWFRFWRCIRTEGHDGMVCWAVKFNYRWCRVLCSLEKLSFEIPFDKELAAYLSLKTHMKLGELILVAVENCKLIRVSCQCKYSGIPEQC